MRILFWILISTTLNSQRSYTTEGKSSTTSKFQLGVSTSVDYNYRTLTNRDGNADIDELIEYRDEMEVGLIGYTSGIDVIYQLTERSRVSVGLNYALRGMQTKERRHYFGTPSPPSEYEVHEEYRITYIDLPILYEYQFVSGKVYVLGKMGVSPSVFVAEQVNYIRRYDDGEIEKHSEPSDTDYKKYTLSGILGINMGIGITEKINIQFGPNWRIGLIEVIDAPISAKLWSVGIECMLMIKL